MATTKLIRAKLTDAEWLGLRKLALDLGVSVSELVGDSLRAVLKGAKP